MKDKIIGIVKAAIVAAHEKGELGSSEFPPIEIEVPKNADHGDFSTNAAMVSARIQKMAPRKIAEAIKANVVDSDGIISGVEIAGPGFINFSVEPSAWHPFIKAVHDRGNDYGSGSIGKGKKVQVEFVSANPTGPLHVGHGRGAAVGDTVARVLSYCGFDVEKEYYINDAGNQIQTLGLSVLLRFQELAGHTIDFPKDCYQGDYIKDIAGTIKLDELPGDVAGALSKDCTDGQYDSLAVEHCSRLAGEVILNGIRDDLSAFGVDFDVWFSEKSLFDDGRVDRSLADCQKKGIVYEKDGALWFKTSDFKDEKDRVVKRSDGNTTYFASDIAYHMDKFERGFDRVINVWGADHHGYVERMKAAVEASGVSRDRLDIILVKLVNLLRAGEPAAMSTRSGEFVPLKDVVDEVGRDAARFIFLTRHYESALDFDLELAKKKTNENPVFYVQYAHARVCSVEKKGKDTAVEVSENINPDLLTEAEEILLIKKMADFPDVVEYAAMNMEPHRVTFYLMELASCFHTYYNKHRALTDDPDLTAARLYLLSAVRIVIKNGLELLGVSAPESM